MKMNVKILVVTVVVSFPVAVAFSECPDLITDFFSGAYQGFDVDVEGSFAFVAGAGGGLRVVDVSDPANPVQVGALQNSGEMVIGIDVVGTHVFAADNFAGFFRVIDVSDPTNPTEVGALDLAGSPWSVKVSGDHAFVVQHDLGLSVIDISNPLAPAEIGFLSATNLWKLVVKEDLVYTSGYSGLFVIDVSDPTLPVEVGSIAGTGCGFGLDVVGATAYVGGCSAGLFLIDVSEPTSPTGLGVAPAFDESRGVLVSGANAYVAGYQGGFRVIDVSDPLNPLEIGSYDNTDDYSMEVALSGSVAFVVESNGDLVTYSTGECDLLFSDGFEDGDTSDWSLTVP